MVKSKEWRCFSNSDIKELEEKARASLSRYIEYLEKVGRQSHGSDPELSRLSQKRMNDVLAVLYAKRNHKKKKREKGKSYWPMDS